MQKTKDLIKKLRDMQNVTRYEYVLMGPRAIVKYQDAVAQAADGLEALLLQMSTHEETATSLVSDTYEPCKKCGRAKGSC